MKTLLRITGLGLLGAALFCAAPARAVLEVSASVQINARTDFEVPLASSGAWVEVGTYGRCWHPARVAVGWRPYCEGRWVWTDCGWYWQSDEPWGWACYHYGRWAEAPNYGWVWIPDVEWAPSWVYWRSGGGYVGWAPCPPAGVVVEPRYFAFVEVGHFSEPIRTKTVIVNNTTIINKTTVINNVRQETRTVNGQSRRVVVNDGPGATVVQQATKRTVAPTPIQVAARQSAPSTTVVKQVEESRTRAHSVTRVEQQPGQNQPKASRPPTQAPPNNNQVSPQEKQLPHSPSEVKPPVKSAPEVVKPEEKRALPAPKEPRERVVPPTQQPRPTPPPITRPDGPTVHEKQAPIHEQPAVKEQPKKELPPVREQPALKERPKEQEPPRAREEAPREAPHERRPE